MFIHICLCVIPHHGHPAQSGDALADGRQVVEEAAAAVSFSEVLDLLDVIGDRLQQVTQLRLGGDREAGEGSRRGGEVENGREKEGNR